METPKAVTASSIEDPVTPHGGEGASRARAAGFTRRAASWQTRPPIEWPISTGGSGRLSHRRTTLRA